MAFILQTFAVSARVLRVKRTTIYLTDHQVASIQAIVEATGLKFAEVLRRLLDRALATPPPSDE